jgi:hypothetical protein
MNIWQFSEALSQRLLSWNIVNVFIGLILSLLKPFWRGVGSQSIGWGFVNIAIAIVGGKAANRRYENLPNPLDSKVVARESKNLRRILWVNTALDVLYMIGGLRLSRTRGKNDDLWRGIGMGIVIQGALLFVFDLIYARIVPDER